MTFHKAALCRGRDPEGTDSWRLPADSTPHSQVSNPWRRAGWCISVLNTEPHQSFSVGWDVVFLIGRREYSDWKIWTKVFLGSRDQNSGEKSPLRVRESWRSEGLCLWAHPWEMDWKLKWSKNFDFYLFSFIFHFWDNFIFFFHFFLEFGQLCFYLFLVWSISVFNFWIYNSRYFSFKCFFECISVQFSSVQFSIVAQ